MATGRPTSRSGTVDVARPGNTPKLAKLTRPHVAHAVHLHRLFAHLDETKDRPIVWVHGPPGAGKTTLIASYLSARKRSGIWYQVDAGDADPASFFYYFGLAITRKRRPMPLLTPEYLLDIDGFTRRFFREVYSRLGETAVVVLDNYHEVAATSAFHKLIACALSEVAPGIRVVVVSRAAPPPEYARHIANSLITEIGWEALRLTMEETALIASASRPIDPETAQALYERSNGWTAGLILMLERHKHAGAVLPVVQSEALETVFNYFAGEVFERLEPDVRDFLLKTCVLPRVTADLANAVTGRTDADRLLAGLHKRQLFIDRRTGAELSYQYHALFALFLQARARTLLTDGDWNALRVASAQALATHGHLEEAIPLFIAVQAWDAATSLIVTQAQTLLALGRWQTLEQWIAAIPEAIRNTVPWLRFWLGMCRLRIDPAKARVDLEPAFARFLQNDDTTGQALAATAINEAHMLEWIDFGRLDPWIAVLDALLNRREFALPSPDTELAVRASLFAAIIHRQPYREDVPLLARQLTDMLREDLDPNYKLLAARGLFVYGTYSGDFNLMDEVVCYTASAFNTTSASAINRAWYAARYGFALRYAKNARDMVRTWFTTARDILRSHGLSSQEAPIAIFCAWAEDVVGDVEDIRRELRVAEVHLNRSSRFELAFRRIGMATLHLRLNERAAAVANYRAAFSFFEQCGYTLAQVSTSHGLIPPCLDCGDIAGARQALDSIARLAVPGALKDYAVGMLGASIALATNDDAIAQSNLRAALPIGAKHALENTLSEYTLRPITSALCAYALTHGIEPDYVKRIIRTQRLTAPSPDIEYWPWPVRLRTFGGFFVEIDDRPLVFSGKTPKKPLELLKVLVASGTNGVDVGWLSERLWPDAEGDAARDALKVTLARLRKILAIDNALELNGNKLSLNPVSVWADSWAFDQRVADGLATLGQAGAPEADSVGASVLTLYTGDLLKGEPDTPWLIEARDRYRSKFLRSVKALADYWEVSETPDKAQSLYEQALEVDSLDEDLYRRLMQSYLSAGRTTEALRVYQRCCQMLSTHGLASSPQMETLAQSIRSAT